MATLKIWMLSREHAQRSLLYFNKSSTQNMTWVEVMYAHHVTNIKVEYGEDGMSITIKVINVEKYKLEEKRSLMM